MSSRKSGVAVTDDLSDWVADRIKLGEQQLDRVEEQLCRNRGGGSANDVVPDPPPHKPPQVKEALGTNGAVPECPAANGEQGR